MKIALAQINPTVGDLKGNKALIEKYIALAKGKKSDIVVFPELAVCGYPPEDLLHKDHFVKDNIKILKSICPKANGIAVIVGFVDMDRRKNLYNAAAVLENKKIKGIYHKKCLPNYGVFDEKRYFTQGQTDIKFSNKTTTYAINICEDIWEDICQTQAKAGAKVLINLSSSPYSIGKQKEREALIKRRAKQSKAFICYCNLVGGQDELVFDGGSVIVDPKGRTIAAAKEFEEDMLVVDLKKVKTIGTIPQSKAERVFKALVLGTRDYANKNGFKKAILGLSGGIDSSLVAAVAVEALGKNNVIGVSMPSRYSSEGTKSDAKILAANLGIKISEVPIDNIYESYMGSLNGEFQGQKSNIAEENIQARIRGNIIMGLSNKFSYLVLTTGNKSEVAVGYCTLYGDMSGGFAVIKDVPKTLVYELCRYINSSRGKIIPESIIKRAPSAELRENQKDSDSLPAYNALDKMLKDYVEDHKSLAAMAKGKNKATVKEIITLIDRNEYKRRQAPPGIKITPRAFGRDWRLPITNKYKEF